MPDLSIIIVNWNTISLLRDVLKSTFDNIGNLRCEVIVVDNASADGSAEMVEAQFPNVILVRNAENRGFAAGNNQGFELAHGRHILLLNSDTIVHGDVLSASVKYLDDHPDVGAMGCRVLNSDGTVQLTCSRYPSLLNQFLMATGLWKLKWPRFFGRYLMTDWARNSEREVEAISGCYLLVRSEVLHSVGSLDEDFFFFGEETDWCYRMRKAGWRLMFAPVGEITHHGSVSARKLNHRRDLLLTSSKVRLHRKHNGFTSAIVCWLIAAFFNGGRAIYWNFRRMVSPSEATKQRAQHFFRVTASLGRTWTGRV